MTKKIVSIIITILAVVVTLQFLSLGFIWAGISVLSIIFIAIIAIIKLFKKNLSVRWFTLPATILAICFICITVQFLMPSPPALPIEKTELSDEIRYIESTDQDDRSIVLNVLLWTFIDAKKIMTRDSLRLNRILEIVKDTSALTPQDKYYAAMVLQHGNEPVHYELAHKLSSFAAAHKVPSAEWLSQASWDRWQLSIGKPQKYGTQYNVGN